MANGKDGFESLSEAGGAEIVVDDENGVLISMMLRQYFLSLKIVGRWHRGTALRGFFNELKKTMKVRGEVAPSAEAERNEKLYEEDADPSSDSDSDVELAFIDPEAEKRFFEDEHVRMVARKALQKWERLAGINTARRAHLGADFNVDWTTAISPKIEGRIINLTHAEDEQVAVLDSRHPDEINA